MLKLPESFDGRADQRGFHFTQIKRHGKIALFQKQKSGGGISYEVVLVHRNAKRTFPDGRVVEPKEAMPSPEEWGTGGWSYPSLAAANEKFNRLLHPDRHE